MNHRHKLGPIGIWSLELRFGDAGQIVAAAAELEELGYSALWIPGGVGGDVFGDMGRLHAATRGITIASGIVNIWKHSPRELSAWWHAQSRPLQARTLLGLGVSHGPLIGATYSKPLATMKDFLSKLAAEKVPSDALCIAALAPKMLKLSADATAGTHPYLVTPEHSALARSIIGPEALLAPEQGVILETQASRARELGRQAMAHYRGLPNYVNNWLRLGFTAEDIEHLSDRVIDALFAWGSTQQIAARVNAHLAAGADHVCLQVITGAGIDVTAPQQAWRELAAAFNLPRTSAAAP